MRRVLPWLLASAASVLAVLSVRASVSAMRDGRPWVDLDLGVYLSGAAAVRSHDLYDLLFGPVHLPFTYPPVAAAAMWPLTLLPPDVVSTAWLGASVLALAVLLWMASPRLALPWRVALVAAVMAAAAWLEPVQSTWFYGQVNLVLAVLVLADVVRPTALRRLPGGVLVGVAAAIKLTPLVFVAYLLVVGRRRDAARAAVTFVVLAGVGLLVNPGASWTFWTSTVVDGQRVGNVEFIANRSILGVWARRAEGQAPSTIAWLAVAATMLVVGLLAARFVDRRLGRVESVLVVALSGLLVAPIAWVHHFVWIAPLLMVVVSRPMNGWMRLAGLTIVAIFAWQPVWFLAHDRADLEKALQVGTEYQLVGCSYVVGAVLAVGWLVLLATGRTGYTSDGSGSAVSARATSKLTDASTSDIETSSAPQIAASSSLDASFWPRSTSDR